MEDTYHKKRFEIYAAFGLPLEEVLKPVLERELGHSITKTEDTMDTVDFYSDEGYAELKCRRPHQCKEEYSLWILPVDKVFKAIIYQKPMTLFYYWDNDKTLYKLTFDEDLFFRSGKIKLGIPAGSSQNHFWIPQDLWTQIAPQQV